MKMANHDKKSLANEYCLCRNIPHYWVDNGFVSGQLSIGSKVIGKYDTIFSIYNIPYSEIIPTIDRMCEYNEFGKFIGLARKGF